MQCQGVGVHLRPKRGRESLAVGCLNLLLVLEPVVDPWKGKLRDWYTQKLAQWCPALFDIVLQKLSPLCSISHFLVMPFEMAPPMGREVISPTVRVVLSGQGQHGRAARKSCRMVMHKSAHHGFVPCIFRARSQNNDCLRIGLRELFGEYRGRIVRNALSDNRQHTLRHEKSWLHCP